MKKLAAVVVLAGACGGGGGSDSAAFIGTYTTMSHTSADSQGTDIACTSAGAPVADARAFFQIEVDPFFMSDDFLTVTDCNDAAGADCVDALVTLMPGGDGLDYEAFNTQTGGGTMCNLYYSRATATLSGSSVHVESIEKFAAPSIASDQCTLDKAEALADSPDCRHVERWDGTKI